MDTKAFALAMDDFHGPEAIAAWRQQRLTNADNRLVHAPTVVLDAKSRGTVEGILERIYPTKYEPPELLPDKAIEQLLAERPPQTLSQVIEQLTTGATPTAFETRNTGLTMQAKAASVRGDNHLCDVSLSFEEVQLLGFELFSQNRLSIPQPHFTHFRSTTLLRTTTGRWQLLSAQAPPPTLRQQPSHNTWITILRVDPVP